MPTKSRDAALILLVALIVVCAMICATVLAIRNGTDTTASFGLLTAGVGIAGVALGRLSGAPAPAAPAGGGQVDAAEIDDLVGDA